MKRETLCWTCKNAAGAQRCSWSSEFIPVEGWNAMRSDLQCDGRMIESYCVIECPQYMVDLKAHIKAERPSATEQELGEKQKEAVEKLRCLHDEYLFTQEQIAWKVGYAASSIAKWVNMTQGMRVKVAENILRRAEKYLP